VAKTQTKTDAFRAWRKEHGLTQEAAARAAGVTLSGWRVWEADPESKGPPVATVVALERLHPGLWDALRGAEFGAH